MVKITKGVHREKPDFEDRAGLMRPALRSLANKMDYSEYGVHYFSV